MNRSWSTTIAACVRTWQELAFLTSLGFCLGGPGLRFPFRWKVERRARPASMAPPRSQP